MTMGNLRVSLLVAYVVIGGAVTWTGSSVGRFDAFLAGVLAALPLLAIPTLRLTRVSMDTPVATLGILPVSLLVFGLGLAAPVLLMFQPWAGLAGLVLLVAAYVAFERKVSRALSREHEVLRPSAGDADLGVFTALTPMSPPPTITGGPSAGESHSRYDPTAVCDPLAEWTRKPRHED